MDGWQLTPHQPDACDIPAVYGFFPRVLADPVTYRCIQTLTFGSGYAEFGGETIGVCARFDLDEGNGWITCQIGMIARCNDIDFAMFAGVVACSDDPATVSEIPDDQVFRDSACDLA